uniref:Colicin V production protein n=1 Tax=Heterorhabditis bacteriophora TaxID=37862 RepID=A0A1I7XS35_HETBA
MSYHFRTEAAISSVLLAATLTGIFFSIVFYRYLHHLYSPEPEGFFCMMFSTTFSPLFDAICQSDQPTGFFSEISQESQKLAEEVGAGISGFFASIFDGFHAFRTIFTVMFSSLLGGIGYGIHELVENVSENIAFLLRFCTQFIDFVLYICTFTVSLIIDCALDILTHVQSYIHWTIIIKKISVLLDFCACAILLLGIASTCFDYPTEELFNS